MQNKLVYELNKVILNSSKVVLLFNLSCLFLQTILLTSIDPPFSVLRIQLARINRPSGELFETGGAV